MACSPKAVPTHANQRQVYLLIIDPLVEGKPLTEVMHWNDAVNLSAEYISDVAGVSGGALDYVISHVEVDRDFPAKEDGHVYSPAEYLAVARQQKEQYRPEGTDYLALIEKHGIAELVNNGSVDELWVFGAPWFGFYESRLVGKGGFFYNSPPLEHGKMQRLLPVMGFSYERGVAEMLEDLGHRTESTMTHVYGGWDVTKNRHPFDRYGHNAGQTTGVPYYGVGSVHFPPNGEKDYDWANPRSVLSNADGWLTYPDVEEKPRSMNCSEWGCSARGYLKWWFARFPHAAGESDGILNNWWKYVADPALANEHAQRYSRKSTQNRTGQ